MKKWVPVPMKYSVALFLGIKWIWYKRNMCHNVGFTQWAHAVLSFTQQLSLAWMSQFPLISLVAACHLCCHPDLPCFFLTEQFTGSVLMLCSVQCRGLSSLSSQCCHLSPPGNGLLLPCAQGRPQVPCAQSLVTVWLMQDLLWSASPHIFVAVQWNRLGKNSATNSWAKSQWKREI